MVGKEGEENMIVLNMDVMEMLGELGVELSINEENVKTTMEVLKTKLACHKETQVRFIQEISPHQLIFHPYPAIHSRRWRLGDCCVSGEC